MIFSTKQEFIEKCPNGRLIGLDVGTKTIGIAITDDTRTVPTPVETLIRKGNKKDFAVLLDIFESKRAKGIVIGLPVSFNGKDTACSLFIRRFAKNLSAETTLPIIFQDERLSSFMAEDLMIGKMGSDKIKRVVDKIAASYILESFLTL